MHCAIRHFFAYLGVAAMCLGTGLNAQAQVVRCTDAATGKVTYTDSKCPSSAAALEVEARKTPEQIHQEREQAAQAIAQKNQRLQAQEASAQAEALRNSQSQALRSAQQSQERQDPARSPECARSRRSLDTVLGNSGAGTYEQSLRLQAAQRQVDVDCLGPSGYAQAERARAAGASGAGAIAPVVVVPPYYPERPGRPHSPGSQPRPTPQPAQKKFTQCNVFRCYDAQGNVYPR